MAIDTQTKRRSVSGYSGIIIAPLIDGTIDAFDREHVVGLYAGISATPPPVVQPPYQGAAYMYDDMGTGEGSIAGGTVFDGPNQNSPTGSISGGTILNPDQIYD